jgi:hypothetical protein
MYSKCFYRLWKNWCRKIWFPASFMFILPSFSMRFYFFRACILQVLERAETVCCNRTLNFQWKVSTLSIWNFKLMMAQTENVLSLSMATLNFQIIFKLLRSFSTTKLNKFTICIGFRNTTDNKQKLPTSRKLCFKLDEIAKKKHFFLVLTNINWFL